MDYKKPILYINYTDGWGNVNSANMEIDFNDSQQELGTLFEAFSRFCVLIGYSSENVKEYYEYI
jgi:hypothetical protein